MPRTSKEVDLKIINFHHENWRIYAISKNLTLFTSTITRIMQRYKQNGTGDYRESPGIARRISQKMVKLLFVRQKRTLFHFEKSQN